MLNRLFELSVACKYLIPRWRQLSVSIISLLSTFVIALVVWLIVVFFSVKDGLENNWIDKIVGLTAPIRLLPTDKYYRSYYYLVDGISNRSEYTTKTIAEKLQATVADPYDPNFDEEIPAGWVGADREADGSLKDLVKTAYQAISQLHRVKGLKGNEYETTIANLHLQLMPYGSLESLPSQQTIDHSIYIGTFDSEGKSIANILLPLSSADFNHLLFMQSSSGSTETNSVASVAQRIQQFFDEIQVTSLKVPSKGWVLPRELLPDQGKLTGVAVLHEKEIVKIILSKDSKGVASLLTSMQLDGLHVMPVDLQVVQHKISYRLNERVFEELPSRMPLLLEPGTVISAKLDKTSLIGIRHSSDIRFALSAYIQGVLFSGEIPMGSLMIDQAEPIAGVQHLLFASSQDKMLLLPPHMAYGEPIILPKLFKEAGSVVGDSGYLSYFSPTPSMAQDQRIPIYVAGFYDPGIMPLGNKYVLASKELTSLIRSSYGMEDALMGNGINVRFDLIEEAAKIKKQLVHQLELLGMADYWEVQTYQEFDFTKDLLQQLRSEKNLFSLISLIIIIVACSNIISMLIILVNDKKTEIGILRSMGASSRSIGLIFGICGMVMGGIGSLLGIAVAMITLHFINELVGWISSIQGYDLFNPIFYGTILPSHLSYEALFFVICTTVLISLLAGVVPAVKASMIRPSMILRAE